MFIDKQLNFKHHLYMKLLIRLTLNVFTLLIVAFIIPGFIFDSLWTAIVSAVVIGAVNTFIRPVLQVIFIPLSIITFGVTAILINVVLLWGVSFIIPGFEIDSFLTAVFASLALSLISMFLHKLGEEDKSK